MKPLKLKIIIIISFMIVTGIGVRIYAVNNGNGPHPEIDGWKGTNDVSLNGSGVEYNGIRIGNTVWCKPGDVLGVTAWGKELWGGDYKNTISDGYLCLSSSNAYSVYDEYTDGNGDNDENGSKLIKNGCTEISLLDSALGHGTPEDRWAGSGNLFWLLFDKDDMIYGISANFLSFNGNYLNNNFNDTSSWTKSVETIKTDGHAPKIEIKPGYQNWTNKDVNVDININDGGCGVQKYMYSISKNGESWQDSKWIYAKDSSKLDNTPFDEEHGTNAPVQLAGSEDRLDSTITLSDEGAYQIRVQAVDNLGNGSDIWQYSDTYEIDKTKPTGTYDPDAGSSSGDYYDNLTVNFYPKDNDGGSGMKNWRYRLSNDDGASWGTWSDYIDGDSGQYIDLSSVGKWRIDAEACDNAGNVNEIISGPYNIVLSLEAVIVPYDDPDFIGTPTLKKGQMAHLKIITRHYADHLSITFPYAVLADGDALQNYIDGNAYNSFSNKEINIAEPEEEDDDSNGVDFVIPISKDIPNELENVHVKAHYHDGSTKEVWPEFKVKDSVTDHIKVSTLP